MYALTLVKDTSKLKPFQEGSCVSVPDAPFNERPAPPPGQRYCVSNVSAGIKPSVDADGVTLEELARLLNLLVDRHVIDETGVSGRFDIHLTFARDQALAKLPPLSPSPSAPGVASEPGDPTVFTAVQEQLGLKLVPTKRPVEILVIDSVERPSEN